jgi:hypothetical protein
LTVAQKPDGKSARTERVTFTRPAAERIAKAVRQVEGGDRDTPGIYFGSAPGAAGAKTFRVCTFTGSWGTHATDEKTLTLKYQTTTPNTVSAKNLTFHLPDIGTGPYDCEISKEGTAWFLVSALEHNVKRGTFTAPWTKTTLKTIVLSNGGSVTALNRHATITGTATKNCTVGRDGMDWELIAAEC